MDNLYIYILYKHDYSIGRFILEGFNKFEYTPPFLPLRNDGTGRQLISLWLVSPFSGASPLDFRSVTLMIVVTTFVM